MKYYVFLFHLSSNHRPYRVRIFSESNPTVDYGRFTITRLTYAGLSAHMAESLSESMGKSLNIPFDTLCY